MSNKYHARKVTLDGHTFDSKHEANRWSELCLLQKGGKIRGLEVQPEYPIVVNGVKVCTYRADFRYREVNRIGSLVEVVEDAKGVRTPVYKLKKKLVEALYGIQIIEV